jgi:hypothetical protein
MFHRQESFVMTAWLCRLPFVVLMVAAVVVSTTAPLFAQGQSGITSPAPGSVLSGDVQIMGTAVIEPFQKYELHYKLEPSGDDAYIYFGGSTSPIVNGPLGVWQAGGLPPGTYSLRLRVVKADGNYAEFYIPNLSVNQGSAPTPTSSEPTPTPIPTATYTPAPQPTAAVGAVEQPQVEASQPFATPTPDAVAVVDSGAALTTTGAAAVDLGAGITQTGGVIDAGESSGLTRELGEALAFERLRSQFWSGVRYSVLLCLGVLALFGGKRLFDWVWTQFR